MKRILPALLFLPSALALGPGVLPVSAQAIEIEIQVNVKHAVGGVSTLDRKKFMTIHSSHPDREWTEDYRGEGNFTEDLLTDFFVGNDVYFGRDTGYISWHLRNTIGEDPARPGWARVSGSNDSIADQGLRARNLYHQQVALHRWEERDDNIMAPQYRTFWPDGTPTNKGWALSQTDTPVEPLGSATGAFVGEFLNHFYGNETQVGRPLPKWVEVMNEPDWPLMDNGNTPARVVWEFHNAVANEIRKRNKETLIGGYCTTFPDLEENNFQEWREEWKLFIDLCGANMDFYTLHFYDFPVFGPGGNTQYWRKGSNLEATLDMIEHYSFLKVGEVKPFVISEYGAATHYYFRQPWSAYRDWLKVKSMISMMISFMDRPNQMLKTIPFIVCKGEWGRISETVPHYSRLMRQANEPGSPTGEWVYTEAVKMWQLLADVKGTRIKIQASDPDIQTDAYVEDDKAYVILNNLDEEPRTLQLNLFEEYGNIIQSARQKNLYWNGELIALEETIHPGGIGQVELGAEGTAVLEFTFSSPVKVNHSSIEVKHYATSYFKPITAEQTEQFEIPGVSKGAFGEAVLRLGMGREHERSKTPAILFNGTAIDVPTDFMGHEGDDRELFFGQLDIPVPYAALEENNVVSVTFPDSGGYITSVSLRSFAFSKNLSPNSAGNFQIASIQKEAEDISLTIVGGEPLARFDLLSSDDLSRPFESWTVDESDLQFDATGRAVAATSFSGSRRFFQVRQMTP